MLILLNLSMYTIIHLTGLSEELFGLVKLREEEKRYDTVADRMESDGYDADKIIRIMNLRA